MRANIGSNIGRSSTDELPQIFNGVRGAKALLSSHLERNFCLELVPCAELVDGGSNVSFCLWAGRCVGSAGESKRKMLRRVAASRTSDLAKYSHPCLGPRGSLLAYLPLPSSPTGEANVATARDAHALTKRRFAAFLVLPFASAITPLVSVPSITHNLGARGWGAVALGQSVGVFTSIAINYGWGTVGPARVAASTDEARVAILRTSLAMRSGLFILLVPLSTWAAAALAPSGFRVGAALTAVVFATWGLSPTWYFIGCGRPALIATFDTVPSVLGAVAAAILLFFWRSAIAYALCIGSVLMLSLVISTLRFAGRPRTQWIKGAGQDFRSQAGLTLSRILAAGFVSLSTAMVAVGSPSAVPLFAAGDRIRALGTQGLFAVVNALQAWVAGSSGPLRHKRFHMAFVVCSFAGAIGGVVVAALLPLVDVWIFSGQLELPLAQSIAVGGVLTVVAVASTITFHALVPSGQTRAVTLAGIVGSFVGVPLIIGMARIGGATGATYAILVAELVSTAVLAWAYFRTEISAIRVPREHN